MSQLDKNLWAILRVGTLLRVPNLTAILKKKRKEKSRNTSYLFLDSLIGMDTYTGVFYS